MTPWRTPFLALCLSTGCTSTENGDHGGPSVDASEGGAGTSSGGIAGKAGAQGAGGGNGGAGGAVSSGGTSASGAGGAGAASTAGGARGAGGAGGAPAIRDASPADATSDARAPGSTDAGCRGAAAAFCPTGEWQKYDPSGAAHCAACPGPALTCAGFDLAASTFTPGATRRLIKMALVPGAAEILLDQDIRMTPTFEGTSCGGNPIVTTFSRRNILVEHDALGHTFLTVDIGVINSTMVPCGDVRLLFNDGCCTSQEVHVSVIYVEGTGATTFSCKDAG